MDSTATPDLSSSEFSPAGSTLLAQLELSWADAEATTPAGRLTAAVLHVGAGMLLLDATEPNAAVPPPGTQIFVRGDQGTFKARVADHGGAGRFLVSIGERPVRGAPRLKVSLPANVRSPALDGTRTVEIVDLTTGGARLRGLELPVGSQLTLGFTPPYRDEPVSVRAVVVHGTHRAALPWVGVVFRLVAFRGGR